MLGTAVVLIIIVVFLLWFRQTDKQVLKRNIGQYHPITKALLEEKVILNQSVSEIIAAYPHPKSTNHDNYTTLFYFKDSDNPSKNLYRWMRKIWLCCKDGKVVKASATLPYRGGDEDSEYIFFNNMSPEEFQKYYSSLEKWAEENSEH